MEAKEVYDVLSKRMDTFERRMDQHERQSERRQRALHDRLNDTDRDIRRVEKAVWVMGGTLAGLYIVLTLFGDRLNGLLP